MDRPYGLLWPLSPFSLAGLTQAASPKVDRPYPIQVVQLEEISDALPVLPIRSDGLISAGPLAHTHIVQGHRCLTTRRARLDMSFATNRLS